MASLRPSHLLSSSSSTSRPINAALSVPKLPKFRLANPRTIAKGLVHELSLRQDNGLATTSITPTEITPLNTNSKSNGEATAQLYAILEAVSDRVEMHRNIGEQRDNWNSLLLNSINMITLTATTMTGIAATAAPAAGATLLALKLSSALLFSAATGMLLIMNKIQPSQLAEEQRNATRLFKQLQTQIETTLALHNPAELDVKDAMEKVLAIDKAYPLPLLGKMIEKFPKKFEPAKWWPKSKKSENRSTKSNTKTNGWSRQLETEIREVIEVIKSKDSEDYVRLGSLALKINKCLAIAGPLLSAVAAAGSVFTGSGSNWAAIFAVTAGALSSAVNTLEHGGQVGMVVEMYRNCAGSFALMEETIASDLEEADLEGREDGEMLEMKVALELGRSLSELRDLAKKSSASRLEGINIDEFASKLF